MNSTLLSEREKRCLNRTWTRRGARLAKHFQNHKSYLKRRVQEVADRVKKNEVHICRPQSHMVGKVNDLLFDDDQDDRGATISRPPAAKRRLKVKVRRPVKFLTHSRPDLICRQSLCWICSRKNIFGIC